MTDYNHLSDLYHYAKKNPVKQHSEEFTFFEILGNVRGQSVLDLACGDGYYTRKIKMCGANLVVGVDISEKMIARAKKIEKTTCYNIDYRVFDACQSNTIGQFDTVTSVYLFPYARTLSMLKQMCNTMVRNLKPGGKMISVTLSPFISIDTLHAQIHYDVEMITKDELTDGAIIQITIHSPQGGICFENTYWSQQTYEHALREAGFKTIVWHEPQISENGIQQHGTNYWHNHILWPGFSVLDCCL
jgi:ubiquinone/menaquinone biosynthesis C-methylase UbiE